MRYEKLPNSKQEPPQPPDESPEPSPDKLNTAPIVVAVVVIVVVIAAVLWVLSSVWVGNGPQPEEPVTPTTPTDILTPTATSPDESVYEPTNTPTLTDTPTPTDTVETAWLEPKDDIDVRLGPGSEYPVSWVLQKDIRADIILKTDDGEWWKIRHKESGREGWIPADLSPVSYLLPGNIEELLLGVPSLPRQTATPTTTTIPPVTFTATPVTPAITPGPGPTDTPTPGLPGPTTPAPPPTTPAPPPTTPAPTVSLPTFTPVPTPTDTPSPTLTPTATPSPTLTPTPTPTHSPTPTATGTDTPTPTGTPPTSTPAPTVSVPTDTPAPVSLGELEVDRPNWMEPDSTEVIQVSIAALLPGVTDIAASREEAAAIPVVGPDNRKIDRYEITIGEIMRVELSSEEFEITAISPAVQPVNLEFAEKTLWRWEIRPIDNSIGQKSLLLRVYIGDEINEDNLVAVKTLFVDVGEESPPPTPTDPLFAFIIAVLVLAILGLIIYLIYDTRQRRK